MSGSVLLRWHEKVPVRFPLHFSMIRAELSGVVDRDCGDGVYCARHDQLQDV